MKVGCSLSEPRVWYPKQPRLRHGELTASFSSLGFERGRNVDLPSAVLHHLNMQQWVQTPSGESSVFLTYSAPFGHREKTCHLCLRDVKLTYEHVPPKRAFNGNRRLWELLNPRMGPVDHAGRRIGNPQSYRREWQAGFRVRTLCEQCNNRTGAASAATYVRFVQSLAEAPTLLTQTAISGSWRCGKTP